MLFAFIFNNKTLFALSFCLNLPAAFTSIVFANSLENYNTLLTFRGMAYLWGHLLIVSIVLWSYFIGFVKIDKKTFLKTVITMAVLYLSAHLINNLLRLTGLTPNYFYTIIPEDGTPLEWFYNLGQDYQLGSFVINPIYLLMSMFFGLVVVIIFYFIYKVLLPLTALKNEKKLLS